MRIIKVLGVAGSRVCLLAAVTAFGCDDEARTGGDDADAGLEADEGASGDGVDTDGTDTDEVDTDEMAADEMATDDEDEPTDDGIDPIEPGETDDTLEADAGSDPIGDDDAEVRDGGAADDESTSDESDDGEPVATDDLDVDDESTDEAETDEAETDEAETDEAESDEAETDEAESDEAESDEAESDEAESDEAETDEAESDEAETDPTPVDVRVANFSLVQTRSEMYISGIDPIVITGSGASAMFYHFEFVEEDAEPQPDPCEIVSVGDCSVSFCPESEADEGEGEGEGWTELVPTSVTFTGLDVDPIETEHKSMIEIVSGSAPEQLETLVGFNAYDTVSYWSGGETARIIVAASDEVPAFDLTFEPPHVPVVTAPAFDVNGQMSIDPSESLSVVWSNAGVGEIHVTLGGSEGDVSRSIQCTAPSSQGSIVIDQSLLDGLSGTGAFATVALASATGTQGDWGYSIVGQYNGPSRVVSFGP